MPIDRVLIVGTTADYVDVISRRYPNRALFLTDFVERCCSGKRYRLPEPGSEVLSDLSRPTRAIADLAAHLERTQIILRGITCFDCESLLLTAQLATAFSLPFASPAAVAAAGNKFSSKRLWLEAGLPCPTARLVRSPQDAVQFLHERGSAVIMKPLAGSGSELVFKCKNEEEVHVAFSTLLSRMARQSDRRISHGRFDGKERLNPRRVFVVEEMIEGEEFSCDFVLSNGKSKIIRISKKILAHNQTFGTIMAYVLPGELPPELSLSDFSCQLADAAQILGLSRAICMLDFIVNRGRSVMLEMTPRPGGDCLPFLERVSSGFDILGFALDFAEAREADPPPPGSWQQLAGLHLMAAKPGIIRRIDIRKFMADSRVLECKLTVGPGHRILMPPDDYDSRRLGYAIIKPLLPKNIEEECLSLLAKVSIKMEDGL